VARAAHRFATLIAAAAVVLGTSGLGATAWAADPIAGQPGPTLLAPANSGATEVKDVILKWSAVAHATGYQVQLSPNGDWTNNTVSLPNGGQTVNTVYEVPVSLPHATYFWRVRGTDAKSHSNWSSTSTFVHDWFAPITVTHEPTGAEPWATWNPVPEASLYRVRYSTDAGFDPNADTHTCWTSSTSFVPYGLHMASAENLKAGDCFDASDLTSGHQYFWEVAAFDDSTAPLITSDTANDGGWECAEVQPECDAAFASSSGAPFTFTPVAAGNVGTATGTPVTGLATTWGPSSTDCTEDVCAETPTFSWSAVPGANFYEVHIFRDPEFSNTYRVFDTPYTSITPREQFFDAQAGTPYYWIVSAGVCRNSSTQPYCANPPDGTAAASPSCPPAGTPATVPTIDSPGGLSPDTMAAGDTQTLTLTGTNFAPGACVSASQGGLIQSINVVSDTEIQFQYTAPNSAPKQPLTFTVVNPDGGTSNASDPLGVVGTFKPKLLGPDSAPESFAKATGGVQPSSITMNANGNPTFNWSDYLGHGGQSGLEVEIYHLQVATDPDFDNVVWDFSDIDMKQFTNPAAVLADGTWWWRVQGIDESGNGLSWSATQTFSKDTTAPKLHLTNKAGVPLSGATFTIVSDEPILAGTAGGIGIASATSGSALGGALHAVSSTKWTFTPSSPLTPGDRYQVTAGGATDAAGNPAVVSGSPVRAARTADDKSAAWQFGSGWTRQSSSNAKHGTFVVAKSGHSASVKLVGTAAKFYGCRGPKMGNVKISLDGKAKATVDEHKSFSQCGVLLWSGKVGSGSVHTLKVAVTSKTGTIDEVVVS
jgi:hypothetical protein